MNIQDEQNPVGTTAPGRPVRGDFACFRTVEGDRPYNGLHVFVQFALSCVCPGMGGEGADITNNN